MARTYLVTGGAGFIGSNYVHHLLQKGQHVKIYDNLSRAGTRPNLAWLRGEHGDDSFELIEGDVRDADKLASSVPGADVVAHLAAQVAVTTSVTNPREDFEINATGTFNVLEAARQAKNPPILLFASTNKVYGGMDDVAVVERDTRYDFANIDGVDESYPLDFHSPYGCSKGAADQYMRDYARIYGLRTVVFRQSCIYGPRQFGVEDQGWAAWFTIAVVTGRPITIFGNGKQVRDMLHVYDLINMYERAIEHIDVSAGQVYNVGGGKENSVSIWREFGALLEKFKGEPIPVEYGNWRPGDQRVIIFDTAKAQRELDWHVQHSAETGLKMLYDWVVANQSAFA
jgi:CDP-paratose 2-epimerase